MSCKVRSSRKAFRASRASKRFGKTRAACALPTTFHLALLVKWLLHCTELGLLLVWLVCRLVIGLLHHRSHVVLLAHLWRWVSHAVNKLIRHLLLIRQTVLRCL